MRRPMVVIAAAVLSGTLCGLPGIPFVYRLIPAVYTVGAAVMLIKKCRGKHRMPLHFFCFLLAGMFAVSLIRTRCVTEKYEENNAFYEKYEATNPGEFDYANYLKSLDICTEEERKALKSRNRETENSVKRIFGDFREKCQGVLEACCTETDAGILSAMLLGSKQNMEEEQKELYQEAGIAHLLAVSGLHVSMIGAGASLLLQKGFLAGRKTAAAAGGVMSVLYAVFTGASVSSLRAAIMFIAGSVCVFAGRKKDLAVSLGMAAVILVLYRPYAITQSGFQLSFLAIAGILFGIWFSKEWENGSSLAICLAVTLFTMPVVAYSYFKIPLYSFILNMAVIPMMTAVFLSGACVLITGLTGIAGILPVLAGAPAHLILRSYEILCNISLRLPGSRVLIGRPSHLQIVLYYLFLFISGFLMRALKNRKFIPAVLFGTYLLSFPILKYRETENYCITAFDVGQGDCFLIHSGNTDILIDCGSGGSESAGSRILENYLLSKGREEIDMVIVTHADSDHINGILYLYSDTSQISVGQLLLPPLAEEDEKYDRLKTLSDSRFSYYKAGDVYTGGALRLSCVFAETDRGAMKDTNRESGVWLCSCRNFNMLFTGDITEKEETELVPVLRSEKQKINVLKCAHHGSDTANSELFLETADPDFAVLSYGRNNRYGHPSEEVTERLEKLKIKMLSTEKHGAITFKIYEYSYEIVFFK